MTWQMAINTIHYFGRPPMVSDTVKPPILPMQISNSYYNIQKDAHLTPGIVKVATNNITMGNSVGNVTVGNVDDHMNAFRTGNASFGVMNTTFATSPSNIVTWQPTPELRFVKRVFSPDGVVGYAKEVLQQKWVGSNGFQSSEEWRDVPIDTVVDHYESIKKITPDKNPVEGYNSGHASIFSNTVSLGN